MGDLERGPYVIPTIIEANSAGFDVRDLVSIAVEAATPQAKARQLRLKRSVNTSLPHSLHGDSAAIGRLLTELVANVVDSTARGEVRLRAEIEDESSSEVTVRFTVSSTFGKISAQGLTEFFERFCLADDDQRGSGADRGQAKCRSLVDSIGGEMSVGQQAGAGASLILVVSLLKSPGYVSVQTLH